MDTMPDERKRVKEEQRAMREDLQNFKQEINIARGTMREFVNTIRPAGGLGILRRRNRLARRTAQQAEIDQAMRDE